MIDFFSKKLNYDFPWEKYSQITVRDFVSGAMENTSASVFMEALQMNSRELRDKSWESIIAHELFHQWFGNLVTCESWANLPLNESFANYSEYLWLEHKHGKDEADYHLYEELLDYLKESETKQEPLIRYYYVDKDDMFDAHSYSKGGCILHLLRNTIGEEAFFAALNLYLTQNKFKAAEIHHFRLAVEEITGKDMNWFFDQYFLKPGHVKLIAEHQYCSGILKINLLQAQDTSFTPIFKMNLKITIYTKDGKIEKEVFMDKDYISINIPLQEPPLNVIIDSDQTLVGTLQHEKKIEEWMHQYENEPKWRARKIALSKLTDIFQQKSTNDSDRKKILNFWHKVSFDKHWNLRFDFINLVEKLDTSQSKRFIPDLVRITQKDSNNLLRAKAIQTLSNMNYSSDIYKEFLFDSSYAVASESLKALYKFDKNHALSNLKFFEHENSIYTHSALAYVYKLERDSTKIYWFLNKIPTLSSKKLYHFLNNFNDYLDVMPKSIKEKSIESLINIATNNSFIYARKVAFETLYNFRKVLNVNAILATIMKNETNVVLKEYYSKFKF
jgi:aminopeptidase N